MLESKVLTVLKQFKTTVYRCVFHVNRIFSMVLSNIFIMSYYLDKEYVE